MAEGVLPFLKSESGAFEPEVVHAMSRAFEEVCAALMVQSDPRGRETIAVRVIELARQGEHDADRLRDRVLRESGAPTPTKPPEEASRWRDLK